MRVRLDMCCPMSNRISLSAKWTVLQPKDTLRRVSLGGVQKGQGANGYWLFLRRAKSELLMTASNHRTDVRSGRTNARDGSKGVI